MKRLALFVSLVLSLSAFAAGPCAGDFKKFCAGPPTANCLKAHREKFSRKCKAEMDTRMEAVAKMETACQQDSKEFCLKDTGPARLACLQRNQANLSTGCKAALKTGPRLPAAQ